ncbi:MAG: SLC13 family permease [Oceanisphaera sp.]|uniref:SLC13 family permease n=1 Tax=Oceanisphaera sp. TaxID=1929979 RepID=UPI003C755DFE
MAWWVLASLGILLLLLVQGRFSPASLFCSWAGGFLTLQIVDQQQVLSSFSNSALITLLLLLLVSLALERSPLLDTLGKVLLAEQQTKQQTRSLLKLTTVTALLSAFLNNTAVVSSLLGMVSKQPHIPASRLLIPLSYASVLGGMTTLVGTSTNLVVNSFVIEAGLPALGMFQFSLVGIPLALLCLATLMFSARWLPSHSIKDESGTQAYFLEAGVLPRSPLVGHSIADNQLRQLDGLFLLEIVRHGRALSPVSPDEIIEANDVLVFTGALEKVQALQRFEGLQLFGTRADNLLTDNLVEVVISNQSELAKRTLREVDFRTMFNAGVVGIRRGERRLTGQLGQIPLRVGDSLLLAVGNDFIQHRNISRNFHVISRNLQPPRLNARQSTLAFVGFASVVIMAAIGIMPLLNGLVLLLAAFLFSGILTLAELRRRFPFQIWLVVGSALVVARGLEQSGAAQLIADGISAVFGGYGVYGAFIGVFLLTLLLTETVTNNAAAALVFPIALSTAQAFDVNAMPFIMAVAFGASACFLMPSGYQTHLMVYSLGRYRVRDYIKTGLPISVVYTLSAIILIPWVFPF